MVHVLSNVIFTASSLIFQTMKITSINRPSQATLVVRCRYYNVSTNYLHLIEKTLSYQVRMSYFSVLSILIRY